MHGWRLLVWFIFLLLPLLSFASLVSELHKKDAFPFDAPIMEMLHTIATPTLDRFFIFITHLGYQWGVVPLDLIMLASLALRTRFRDGLFFGIAISGSAVLNLAAKNYFARLRPDLWLSPAPETTFSFPSGHAMGSATLGMCLIILSWPGRARWPVIVASVCFVALVGVSRVYLGVHYPSDILAGWSAAIAWRMECMHLSSQRHPLRRPRRTMPPRHGDAPVLDQELNAVHSFPSLHAVRQPLRGDPEDRLRNYFPDLAPHLARGETWLGSGNAALRQQFAAHHRPKVSLSMP